MAEGGIVPWTVVPVDFYNYPKENQELGARWPNEFDGPIKDPGFMIAAGFSGPVYRNNPETLNDELDRDVFEALKSRFNSGQLRFALKRRGLTDWYAFVGPNNQVVGNVVEWHTGSDSTFWTFANIVKSVVTAGVATAAESASNAATVSTAAAENAATATQGAAMDWDWDFDNIFDTSSVDYGSVFEPFDFSSGEGFQIFSDAQNVDYGFGAGFGDFETGWNFPGSVGEDLGYNFDLGYDFGTTFESGVSDFGTWFNNTALDPVKDAVGKQLSNKAISSFLGAPKPAPAQNQTPITTKGIANGISNLAGAAMQLIGVRDAYNSTAGQREGQQPTKYSGQLANRPQTIERDSQSPNWMLIGGAVLVAGGAFWYLRKRG